MQAKVNILANPDVVGALDRVNLPDRGATYVVNAVAKALGHDVGNMTLSRSSISRLRNQNHEEATTSLRNESINNSAMLLHWDGKLLPDLTGNKGTVDRLAIILTGGNEEILLGVLKICQGTGKEQADACLSTLDDWGLRSQVRGLAFDTTASNTGLKNGACTL
jgi:hypothetical protein